ncbi:MAG: M67 family metallopeptidase [Bacillota bacterium]
MSNSVGLRLTAAQMREIIALCRSEQPNEACGLLAGRGGRVLRVYPARNADRSSQSFLIHPDDQLRAMSEMERDGLEFTAVFHSHPTSDAVPSHRDIQLATYPDALSLIVSLKREPVVCRAYRIVGGHQSEVPLIIEKEAPDVR